MSWDRHAENALVEAVRRVAKAEIVPRWRALGGGEVGMKSSAEDLVTVADTASEMAIAAAVGEIVPEAAVVGEEAVAADESVLGRIGSGLSVVIDPIDGTWNYANGLAAYGVLVAVMDGAETVFGLIYDPTGDDWILARKGGGVHYAGGGRPERHVAPERVPERVGDAYGFVSLYLHRQSEQELIAPTLSRFRRTQSLRCSAWEYRMMAEGRADFSLNCKLNPWDHAAGVLCLREVGGVARLLDGREYVGTMTNGRLLCARSEALWERVAGIYAPLLS